MTSKRCFFRIMREDFRHKLWMFALSALGNILAVPVVYLLDTGSRHGRAATVSELTYRADAIGDFFGSRVLMLGGAVAVIGALIAGLTTFRFVFHRNMTDTYHSIPVKRRTLFLVSWLNGFLIWFVPFFACMGLTLLLGLGRLGSLRDGLAGLMMNEEERLMVSRWATGGGLSADALISLLALTAAFLLVYHLALLAVMLCGNALNTFVTAGTMGVGISAVYYLFVAFCTEYYDTFVYAVDNEAATYASPLVSSILLLYRRAAFFGRGEAASFWWAWVIDLAVAAALGALAFLAYLKRPSELAEQGIGMRPVRFFMQLPVSLAAAMGGWLVFYGIGNSLLLWGVFGAVLAGVLSFGVMDIIFSMEFKAFFAHKALMGLTVSAEILIGLLFYFDWTGFDGYLPDREEIAEIAVYDDCRSNAGYYGYNMEDEMHPLNRTHIRDEAAAYAFLESAVSRESGENGLSTPYGMEHTEEILAKVTLDSGRTYYRRYRVSSLDNEAALALLTTSEYTDVNFRLGDRSYTAISFQRAGAQVDKKEEAGLIEAVKRAYDRDLEENPEAFIRGDGRLLCVIRLYENGYNGRYRYLEVFEGMEHIREALRQQGLGQFAEPLAAEDVRELCLRLGYWYPSGGESMDFVQLAREVYGVPLGEDTGETGEAPGGNHREAGGAETMPDASVDIVNTKGYAEEIVLHITDQAEIRELLELISYETEGYYGGGAFRPGRVETITAVLAEEGRELSVNIPEGTLPEKYILRFGSLQP